MRKVVFVDVETGGQDPRNDALLEIGAESGCGEWEFQTFVQPEGRRVCEGALPGGHFLVEAGGRPEEIPHGAVSWRVGKLE